MLKYEHLLGRSFSWERDHCYELVRHFYRDNFGIELRSYACPRNWWDHGLNLFSDLYPREGFDTVMGSARDYKAGDLILMSYGSPVANHIGVLLDNGKMLHHMVDSLSSADPYAGGGFWRSRTVGVLRHRDVTYETQPNLLDLKELVQGNARTILDDPRLADAAEELSNGLDGTSWFRPTNG